jgi:hypothetical protein
MSVQRYGLRDDQWERIEAMLPGRKGSAGRPAGNNRLFVEAVLYRYRADGAICRKGSAIFAWCIPGNPIEFHLTGGQACDLEGADGLLPQLDNDILLAGKFPVKSIFQRLAEAFRRLTRYDE